MTSVQGTVKERYRRLEQWATAFTAALELKIREQTAVPAFHCFVHDQFEDAFPEDHLTRDQGAVFIGLRVAIDLQTLGAPAVAKLKAQLHPILKTLFILRDNFQDSAIRVDFDWHVSERERDGDEGRAFFLKVLSDCSTLSGELRRLAQ